MGQGACTKSIQAGSVVLASRIVDCIAMEFRRRSRIRATDNHVCRRLRLKYNWFETWISMKSEIGSGPSADDSTLRFHAVRRISDSLRHHPATC